jgi:hypothetical protein
MAIQKLQQSRGLSITPSDNGGIYAPWAVLVATRAYTGATAASITDTALETDTGLDFIGTNVEVGDIVFNPGSGLTGPGLTSVITSVSGDSIGVNTTGFSGGTYAIFKPMSGLLYVGGAGALAVVTDGGDEVTFTAVPAGSFLPVHIKQVKDTGTSATAILALW